MRWLHGCLPTVPVLPELPPNRDSRGLAVLLPQPTSILGFGGQGSRGDKDNPRAISCGILPSRSCEVGEESQ